MLTKEATLKDLINEVGVIWFKTIVNERTKKLRGEIEDLTHQIPMFLQQGTGGFDLETSIQQFQSEVNVLRNLNDIELYAKKNSFNVNEALFKNNSLSFESLSQFLQQGESISKMLVKLQLGETFSITTKILEKIKVLDLKIGFDETLKNVNYEDVDYWLNKTLEQWGKAVLEFVVKSANDSENVLTETNEMMTASDWGVKLQKAEIVERYFAKFKSTTLFDNFTSPEDLRDKTNQQEIINYSRVVVAIHSALFLIKLNKAILEELKKIVA